MFNQPVKSLRFIATSLTILLLAGCGALTTVPEVAPAAPVASSQAVEAEPTLKPSPAPSERVKPTAPPPTGKSLQPQLAEADINLDEVETLLPPDAIRAIDPETVPEIMVTAAEAEEKGLDPATRLIGVSINGESHGYPLAFLSRHEIVNAEIGGQAVATTW